MSISGNQYEIIKGIADNEELEKYRSCFEKNGTRRDISNLQWIHQQNLVNKHTIYYAIQETKVAAIYTAMPVKFQINGLLYNALQSIDTITDLDHRGKGLFPKLANKLYTDAETAGYQLVYGFPNENSAGGFFKKLNWVSFGEVPFLLKPLRLSYFIKRFFKMSIDSAFPESHPYQIAESKIANNICIKPILDFGSEYELVWESCRSSMNVSVERSADYMNWRFVNKPGEHYSKCGIYIDDKLDGVIVFTIKNKHGGRVGYVMELLFNPKQPSAGKHLLKFAIKVFKKERSDVALAWSFNHSFNFTGFKKCGFYNLPEKLRPQQLYMGVRSFSHTNKNKIENVKNWYISYSDSDTV